MAQDPGLQSLDLCLQNLHLVQQKLEQDKLLYRQQLVECQQQEDLIKNLIKQRDVLRAQYEAFLEQVSSSRCSFLGRGQPFMECPKERMG